LLQFSMEEKTELRQHLLKNHSFCQSYDPKGFQR
jgi:hypothetical protein